MRLSFADHSLKQRCTVCRAGDSAWGEHADAVRRRLAQMDAAPSLAHLLAFPPRLRPAPALGRPGEYTLSVASALHIRFAAVADDGTAIAGLPAAPGQVTSVRIIVIEENHGR